MEVAALGDAAKWPVKVWCDDPGVRWEPLADKGKFRVTVAADAALGGHAIRFYDADNSTDALPFVIGAIPELSEQEPNDQLDKVQVIADLPKLVNGVLEKRGEVDAFAVDLVSGQTLVAAVDAQQSLRSPVDATLQIVSARGNVLAQNLDSAGLDPRIVFIAPRGGRYYVRLFGFPETPDSTIGFAGGESFVYRLTLSHGGFLQGARPLAVSASEETQLELIGVGLPQPRVAVTVPAGREQPTWQLTVDRAANVLELPILNLPILVEQAAAQDASAADTPPQTLPVPCSVTGVLERPGQVDRYRITARKSAKLSIHVVSRELGYPTDGVLRILDAGGKELVRVDDVRKEVDAKTSWKVPADGDYTLEISDAYSAGGPEWLYRVDIREESSDFRLSVSADHFQGKVGSPLAITVTVDRQDGFAQPIRVSVSGLPDAVKSQPVVSEKDGKTAKEVVLNLDASAPFQGPVRIVGVVEGQDRNKRVATGGRVRDLWITLKP